MQGCDWFQMQEYSLNGAPVHHRAWCVHIHKLDNLERNQGKKMYNTTDTLA